jgi:hypothetical protein
MSQQDTGQVDWRPLKGVDLRLLVAARLQAHYAVQWLARIARAYIAPQPDDEHTNLLWEQARDAFVTQPLKTHITFGIGFPDLRLTLHEIAQPSEMICLAGRSDAEVRQWLGKNLTVRGFDARLLDSPSPYQLPAHAIANGAKYDAGRSQAHARVELAAWFSNADLLLSGLQRQMRERGLAASSVRCWPHHFDIATSIKLPTHDADTGYLGIGLSPGDQYYEGPYFYISVHPEPDPALLPKLPSGGHWHTHEFTAAVLTWDKVAFVEEQKAASVDFLQSAVAAALKLLCS